MHNDIHRYALILICALSFAGCSSRDTRSDTQSSSSEEETSQTRCESRSINNYIGQQATSERVEQMRRESGAQTVRTLRPHDPITLDYNPYRLNINIDDDLLIKSVACG